MKDALGLENSLPLPDLPRKLKKREAEITPLVMAWFKKNHPSSVALEIKSTQTNSIPFSAVKPHQMKALLAAKSKQGMSYKIPDSSHVRLPFDGFVLKDTEAYVVACFNKKRICLAIKPEDWQGAKPDTPATLVLIL